MTFKHFFTALLILSCFAAQAQLDTTGLIAHWTFDGHLNDVTGNGHDAFVAFPGSQTPLTPTFSNGVNEDTNAAIRCFSSTIINGTYNQDLRLDTFSITAIVTFDTIWNSPTILATLAFGSFVNPVTESYGLEAGVFVWGTNFHPVISWLIYPRNSQIFNYKPYTRTSRWYYAVMTYDGINFKTYVDGILKSKYHSPNHPFDTTASELVIGGTYTGGPHLFHWGALRGKIDDLRIYNRALPDSEIVKYSFEFFDTTVVLNTTFADTVMCTGDTTINIPYIVSKKFRPDNKFIVQLSDTNFSFANATVIGTDSTNKSGTITAIVPSSTPSGYHLIRIISTSPTDTTTEFAINFHPTPNFAHKFNHTNIRRNLFNQPPNGICKGDSIMFAVDSFNDMGLAPSAFLWQKNGVTINGATSAEYRTTNIAHQDSFRCIITSSHVCWAGEKDTTTYMVIRVDTPKHPSVNISISPSDSLCLGDTATFTVTSMSHVDTLYGKWYIISDNGNPQPYLVLPNKLEISDLHTGDTFYHQRNSYEYCVSNSTVQSNKIGIYIDTNIVNTLLTINATLGGTVPIGADITFTSNFTAGGAAPTYQWLKNNNPIAGATNPTYIAIYPSLVTGDVITLRAKNTTYRCAKPNEIVSTPINIKYTNSISDVKTSNFKLYPNPNDGAFFIQLNDEVDEPINISILNTTGQIVFKKAMYVNNSNGISLSLPVNIPNGIYIIKLNTGTSTESKHITINRQNSLQ